MKDTAGFSAQTESEELSPHQAVAVMDCMLEGPPKAGCILLVPPDITHCYSYGSVIISYLYHRLSRETKARIMPAVGARRAMSREEQIRFFREDVPEEVFLYHDWRGDTVPVSTIPGAYCGQVSGGRHTLGIGTEVNCCVVDGSFDLILSIGQVVPHEVIGMSNYTENILVGLGGKPMISGAHMLGTLCNLGTIMGNMGMPVRTVFSYGEGHFLQSVPLAYVLTIAPEQEGRTALHGISTGASRQVYEHAAVLAKGCCITQVECRAKKVVTYLEPEGFSTTWVGNEAVYRTRMVIEDGGGLLIITPGIKGSDEDPEVDSLIHCYGYRGTPYAMKLVENGAFPGSAVMPAHMVHSSSEGRFTITYAVNPEYVSQDGINRIGYESMDMKDALTRYPVLEMEDRWQKMEGGEEIYVVKAPALGLWRVVDI